MKGLLRKDLYLLAANKWMFVFYLAMFGIIPITSGNLSLGITMVNVIVMTLIISTVTVDEQSGWNRMALSSPVSRRQLVASKYLIAVITMVISLIVSAIMVVVYRAMGNEGMTEGFFIMISVSGTVFVMMMIMLPLMFRFGVEKMRMFMLAIAVAVAVILGIGAMLSGVGNSGSSQDEISWTVTMWAGLAAAAVVLIFAAVSYLVSCRIMARKEY